MRLAFAGTPEFAARSLAAVLAAGHDVALVLTQPDRAAGRGRRLAESAVKRLARERGLPLFQPETLRDSGASADRIRAAAPEALVVVAYGLLLPASILSLPPLGALNVHASLLPRWRGAAPIQRAIMAGDAETGVSIMQLDEGLDTGPVFAQCKLLIAPDDDAQSLHDKIADAGAELLVATLDALAQGRARAVPQPLEGASYARKIVASETELDWRATAVELERKVRALRPSPGAQARWGGRWLKIWAARAEAGAGAPGTVLAAGEDGLRIACGSGTLLATELQRPGGRRLLARDFLRGSPIVAGERLSP